MPEGFPPAAVGAYLHAVPFHRPPQRVHSLPANQNAQVDQQHAPDNHQQLLVLDDLQRGQGHKSADMREVPRQQLRGWLRGVRISRDSPSPTG